MGKRLQAYRRLSNLARSLSAEAFREGLLVSLQEDLGLPPKKLSEGVLEELRAAGLVRVHDDGSWSVPAPEVFLGSRRPAEPVVRHFDENWKPSAELFLQLAKEYQIGKEEAWQVWLRYRDKPWTHPNTQTKQFRMYCGWWVTDRDKGRQ